VEPDKLNSAARALEDAFFAKENARLLQQLRERARQQERRAAMREVVRVDDEALIDHLIVLGLEPETVLALQLVPLAAIAWADGRIEPRERAAVLKAAAAKGVTPDSVAGQMLDSWLGQRPGVTCGRSGRRSRRRSGTRSARRRSSARAASRRQRVVSSA
jgi:hypothetical protein